MSLFIGEGKATKASATNIGVTVEIKNGRVQNKSQNLYHLTPYVSLICVKSRIVAVLTRQICQNNMKCQLRSSTRDFKKIASQDVYYVPAFLSFHYSKISNSVISNSLFVAVQKKGKCLLRPILASSPLLIYSTTKQSFESCGLKKKKIFALQHSDTNSVVKTPILSAIIIRYITNYHTVSYCLSSNQCQILTKMRSGETNSNKVKLAVKGR